MAMMLKYENTSGAAGAISENWPVVTQVALDSSHYTLVMFAHPQCPCTRASMDELDRVMSHTGGRLVARVLFLKPHNFSDDWVHAGLWHTASAIPGVTTQEDPDGSIAKKFGAEISGYTLLYDPHGRLLFHGGITGSRGHAGDNTGEDAIIAFVAGKDPGIHQTPVYGCWLLDNSGSQSSQ
jgi:hypothetical protein